MNIVFMGTPDFAVVCLEAVFNAGHKIPAVFTREDKPVGRHMMLTPPPVKFFAQTIGARIFQPKTLKEPGIAETIASLNPDLIVVVAYGRILPKAILNIAPCINIHASLLPKYRGAAPIQHSIINGERETGVCSMFMSEGIDTGDVIYVYKTDVLPDETLGELYERLAFLGAETLVKTIKMFCEGNVPRTPQEHDKKTLAPMLTKEDGVLNVYLPAQTVYNRYRGVTPAPGAVLNGLKICKAEFRGEFSELKPGEVVDANGVVCGDGGIVRLIEVQKPGGKRVRIEEYLRGNKLEVIQ